MEPARAARALEAWYARSARDLPWRRTRDPWAILVSEVLLQQTRVETAAPAHARLLARFPTPRAMADAGEEEVLRAWAGLGYYRRARSLHAAARALVRDHAGRVPREADALDALPGLGPYTRAAVRAFAFDEADAPLDANVLRVLARWTGETRPVEAQPARAALRGALLTIVREGSPRVLAQAVMELGALVCLPARPRCAECPIAAGCAAHREGQQDVLPVQRAKARPVEERWAFALAVRGHAVLLERRGPGLLEGFWALPGMALGPRQAAAPALEQRLAALGVRARVGPPAARGRWAFTHRVWRYAVHPVRVGGSAPRPGSGSAPGGCARASSTRCRSPRPTCGTCARR